MKKCNCTCVLTEGALDVGGAVPNIGLPKGSNKVISHLHLALFTAACCAHALLGRPLFQELRCHALVVPADEVVGVVDGGAVHWEPADCSCAYTHTYAGWYIISKRTPRSAAQLTF